MNFKKSERGSLLIVAMLLSAIIGISLVSFLKLSQNASKLANRSFYQDAAQNLTDVGLEQVLWSLNNTKDWTNGGFTAISGSPNQYRGTFPTSSTYYALSGNVKGQVKVWVDDSGANPHAVSQATITLGDGSTLVKMAETYFKLNSYFSDGMVGDTINFSGPVTVDSWNSDPNGNGSPILAYNSGIANDGGKVGATSVTDGALDTGQGKIKGYIAVGSADTSGIDMGKQGSVGTDAWVDSNTGIQSGHATFDFTASFPDVPAPSTAAEVLTTVVNVSLPAAGDVRASDGKFYYQISAISMSGNTDTLTITDDVVITTTNTTGTTVQMTGNQSGVVINSGGSLALYTSGNVAITGKGIINGGGSSSDANQPIDFQLYGTRTAAQTAISGYQTIGIKGNGYLSGVVYAPNADVTVNGNGDVLGAVVGHTVTMTGNASFHYDESLANFGGSGLWKISKWRELSSSSDRNTYASQLSF